MKRLLSILARRTAMSLAVVTLMVVIHLWSVGEIYLVGAIAVGYFLAAVFFVSTALRLWRSVGMTREGAKRQMLFGLALRLLMLFAALYAAVHISAKVFAGVAAGFLVGYAVALINLIVLNFSDKG